jgi:hypothetical protein
MVFCFVTALLGGSLYGARLRVEFEFRSNAPSALLARDLEIERGRLAIEATRLREYVELLKLRRDFANKEKLDLSRFESVFERKQSDK